MTDLLDIGSRICVVCGNPDFPSFENGLTTYEICPIFSRQSGYEYDTQTSQDYLMDLRRTWLIDESAKWFHGTSPKGWCAKAQLENAGLTVPEETS